MSQSIKISNPIMQAVRNESALSSRSLAGQVEYWVRIGRAIENSPKFSYSRIKLALNADMSTDELSTEEQEVFFDQFYGSMWSDSSEQESAFQAYIKNH